MSIQLRWSNSGPANEDNAFGEVVDMEGRGCICTHGGSSWLCRSCAERILKDCPETVVRRPTPEERSRLRNGE